MAREQIRALWHRLTSDRQGAVLIETAIVMPVLILLALGSFDVGRMVTRQIELQSGVAEVEAIVLAANAGASTNTGELATLLKNSLSLTDDKVSVAKIYRCDADTKFVQSTSDCIGNSVVSTYVQIDLKDKYIPLWTHFGVSKTFNYDVSRTVQVDTETLPDPAESA
ncbi:hypothetical protein NT2_09_01450 [Caenibius tardaugens NBRC 16725]|uniref:TadE-like domain-containing protein n=1 Tax=Caenibius tardaugens NBRC 16725 TaxID=1219035 RepID=U2YPF4_9SPHN|nr:TadE/TadG family type IV pilus assembly protein [Caenibius tardaugens]AZI35380.1 pilus assembly protein [Caenibius tardaugens NBRC 16725]GAD50537.1 hypothetical protein NT2_09_01450 [Caenibius tardaugens NBRC 16725]